MSLNTIFTWGQFDCDSHMQKKKKKISNSAQKLSNEYVLLYSTLNVNDFVRYAAGEKN